MILYTPVRNENITKCDVKILKEMMANFLDEFLYVQMLDALLTPR